jgi:CubicO group peptidase (beta-lactamase class C family)
MRRFGLLIAVVWLAFVVVPSPARAQVDLGKRLQSVLSQTSGRAAVVAVSGGRVIAAAGRDADENTPLHLASVSKTVTAAAVFRLAEMGEIDLTKPIGTYLGRFVSTPNDEITSQPVSAFLNHSTGLPSNNLRAVTSGLTTWQQYADFAARGAVSRTPGRYLYSNDNYVLLTKLVVDVTDLPFSVAVRKLVWEPLGVAGGGLDVSTRGTQVLGGAGAWVTAPYAVALLLDALNPETNGTKLLSKPWLARMHAVTYAAEYRNGTRHRGDAWGHTGSLYAVRAAAVVAKSGTVYVVLSEGARPKSSEKLFDSLARLG